MSPLNDYTMTNTLRIVMFAGIISLVFACGGGSEFIPPTPPPPPSGPGTGGPILNLTDEQRLAALNECGVVADALGDLKSDAQQQTLVTYLKSRGEFEDAGAMEGNVWARFHDGRLAMFIPDWLDKDSETGGRVGTPDISGGRQSRTNNQRTGVPDGKKVMLFHGLGNAYDDNREYLGEIFSRSHTEYRVEPKDATIENLKTAKNVDIFYINTHGGLGRPKAVTVAPSVFALWTSDSLSVEREIRYKPDLDATKLVYVYALEDLGFLDRQINEWHYGITRLFVAEHMSFSENSIIYLDACNGYTGESSVFKESLVEKARNRKTTYVGWTGVTDGGAAFPASRFIFDRLLGAPKYMLESPPQRPFDLDAIFAALSRYNLGVSRSGSKLDFESTVEGEIMLAPTIENITMDDYNSLMILQGLFGDNARNDGKVFVGGTTVPIDTWTPTMVVCELPVTGPGSSGEVVVVVSDHESNKVPLSEWTIPLHLIRDDFGVKIDARLNLKIRADVHRYRSEPEEVPKSDREDMIELPPGALGLRFSAASTGTYTVGGQRSAQCVKNGCTMRDTESVVGQNGQLPFTFAQPQLGFEAFYKWSTDMKKIDVHVIVHIPNVGIEMETYTFCEKGDPVTSTFSGNTTLGIQTTKPIEFHLAANFDIQKHEVNDMQNVPWGRCESPAYLKNLASWPKVTPTIAPKPDTDARYATVD